MNNLTTPRYGDRSASPTSSGIEQICALPGKLSCWFDRNAYGLAPISPRVLLAYEFGEAGLEKLKGESWFVDLNFPFPFNLLPADFNWSLATGLEIIAPLALILGFTTRFFGAALMVLTVGHCCRILACRMAYAG